MSGDWQMIRDRLDALRREDQIDAAWRQHNTQRPWSRLTDLGRKRCDSPQPEQSNG